MLDLSSFNITINQSECGFMRTFFFFLIDKQRSKATKYTGSQKTSPHPYTGNQKEKGQAEQKKNPPHTPQFKFIHSKKPIRVVISPPMYKLFQLHKLERKECFNLCIARVPSLKAIWVSISFSGPIPLYKRMVS